MKPDNLLKSIIADNDLDQQTADFVVKMINSFWENISKEDKYEMWIGNEIFQDEIIIKYLGRDIMTVWEPIETAPKDGSEILTCNMKQGGIMNLIRYDQVHEQWKCKGDIIVCLQVTHWMPLPQKPTKQKESTQ